MTSDDTCANCGQDIAYGCGCTERVRLKAELAAAQADRDKWKSDCLTAENAWAEAERMMNEAQARVAELEASLLQVGEEMREAELFATRQWSAAIRAAVNELRNRERFTSAGVIWPLLRNEGDSDE